MVRDLTFDLQAYMGAACQSLAPRLLVLLSAACMVTMLLAAFLRRVCMC